MFDIKIAPIDEFDRDVSQTILCRRYSSCNNMSRTQIVYTNKMENELEDDTGFENISHRLYDIRNLMCRDKSEKDINYGLLSIYKIYTDSDEFHSIHELTIFSSSNFPNLWFVINKCEIFNKCGSCDGGTESTLTLTIVKNSTELAAVVVEQTTGEKNSNVSKYIHGYAFDEFFPSGRFTEAAK